MSNFWEYINSQQDLLDLFSMTSHVFSKYDNYDKIKKKKKIFLTEKTITAYPKMKDFYMLQMKRKMT
jgi:hypothetical protein